jgi:hypothetical protein
MTLQDMSELQASIWLVGSMCCPRLWGQIAMLCVAFLWLYVALRKHS